jgi:hypothetical protein
MRTTTSVAAALKTSAPAKNNPMNRLETIPVLSFSSYQAATRSNDKCPAKLFSA